MLISVLLLTVLVAGCAPVEPEPQPVQELTAETGQIETPTVEAAEEETEPEAEEAAHEPTPEDLVVAGMEAHFAGYEDKIPEESLHKLDPEYSVPRAQEYCDLAEELGEMPEPMTDFDTGEDYRIETTIRLNAVIHLCPAD